MIGLILDPRFTSRRAAAFVGRILIYDPSWFVEFGSGLAILLWSIGCFYTRDLNIHGTGWIVPSLGLALGPVRWVLLLRLWYGPRTVIAFFAAAWWGFIAIGFCQKLGIAPMLGVIASVCVMDTLTMSRFSIPCLTDLLAELRARRRGLK